MLVLAGIAVIVLGFLLRFNPLLVIAVSAAVTGWAAGLSPLAILAAIGKAFNGVRYVSIIWIILPVIGLLERYGLQERARIFVAGLARATAGRLLIVYLLFRQITAAIGLNSIAGPAHTVRPLVAPMAEALAETQAGPLDDGQREHIRAMAAATDNVGVFFGEDIFLAIGSVLLIKGLLEQFGIVLQPFSLSLWAIPSAIAAFLIHGARLLWLDRRLGRQMARRAAR
ncbi:DUF969 domain-containing protein [Sphingomonas abietis]|uniref:DUF969 domain-containing protein n=1 Tax=Sphingomonas abietis TaxID=3012344 RepID=A0ABY7NUV5_9SPHN|nr:DUF969 domain-containing protein [Sphingomonas abietis]WBO23241.1 DUF969 domain-containing protein [Sphingomonas abietis]